MIKKSLQVFSTLKGATFGKVGVNLGSLVKNTALALALSSTGVSSWAQSCSEQLFSDALQVHSDQGSIYLGYNSVVINHGDQQLTSPVVYNDFFSSVLSCGSHPCQASQSTAPRQQLPAFQHTSSVVDFVANEGVTTTIGDFGTREYRSITIKSSAYVSVEADGHTSSDNYLIDVLNISNQGQLVLRAGNYWVNSLNMDSDSTLRVEGEGTVKLFVRNSLNAGWITRFNTQSDGSPGDPNQLVLIGYSDILFNASSFSGYAYGMGGVHGGLFSYLNGGVAGGYISLQNFSWAVKQTPNGLTNLEPLCASTVEPDSDQDGVPDAIDACPETTAGAMVNAAGCADFQTDSDGDGINNSADSCPGTAVGTPVDASGCAIEALANCRASLFADGLQTFNTAGDVSFGYNASIQDNPDTEINTTSTNSNGGSVQLSCDSNTCTASGIVVPSPELATFQTSNVSSYNGLGNGQTFTIGAGGERHYGTIDAYNNGTVNVDASGSEDDVYYIDQLSIGYSSTVNLRAGTYWVRNLVIGDFASLNIIGEGTVRLYAQESLNPAYNSTMNQGGDPNQLTLVTYGDLSFNNTKIAAYIISQGAVSIGYQTEITGALVGSTIWTNTDATINYQAPGAMTDLGQICPADLILDTDNDGINNDFDICPDTPAGEAADANGCSPSQLDNGDDDDEDDIDTGYSVYYGDFDGDGSEDDIYFHGNNGFALIYSESSDSISVQQLQLDESSLTSLRIANEGVDYIAGDLLSDGSIEVIVRGAEEEGRSAVIRLEDQSAKILAEVDSNGRVREGDTGFNETSVFNKNLSDRGVSISIVAGQLLLDDLTFVLSADNDFSAADSLAVDEAIDAPMAPELTVASVDSALLAEMDQVGTLGGAFKVTERGAASYSVPIKVAQGTAGVSPKFSLDYSSDGSKRGPLGLGWSLSGGGAVSRCRQVLQVDQTVKPIRFNEDDRFCLNGQRLLLVSSGKNYGEDGAQYKTEIDTFVTVTSHGEDVTGPDYFTVEAKDGSTTWYGGSGNHNSEQKPWNGSTALDSRVLSWGIQRFEDSIGNAIVYLYSNTPGHYRLEEARFAYGNNTDVDSFGAKVVFEYAEVSVPGGYQNYTKQVDGNGNVVWTLQVSGESPPRSNVNGYSLRNNSELAYVRSYGSGGDLVREYQIEYDAGSANKSHDDLRRISSIQECISTDVCIPATSFKWGDAIERPFRSNDQLTVGINFLFNVDSFISHTYGDFNGDGLLDVAYLLGNQESASSTPSTDWDHLLRYAFQQPDGTFQRQTFQDTGETRVVFTDDPYAENGSQSITMRTLDLNADGRTDLALYRKLNDQWHFYVARPTSDGVWKLKEETAFTLPIDTSGPTWFNGSDDVLFKDFNSDGLVDLVDGNKVYLGERADGLGIPVNLPYRFSESSTALPVAVQSFIEGETAMGDFNNDGLIDLVDYTRTGPSPDPGNNCLREHSIRVHLQESAVAGALEYSQPINVFTTTETDNPNMGQCPSVNPRDLGAFIASDINGDGALDLLFADAYQNQETLTYGFRDPAYMLGKGDGSFEAPVLLQLIPDGIQGLSNRGDALSLVDYDGDGDLDLTWRTDYGLGLLEEERPLYLVEWTDAGFELASNAVELVDQEGYETMNEFIDADGDGSMDRIRISDGKLYLDKGTQHFKSHRITEIENGLGMVTQIEYELLNKSEHYIFPKTISIEDETVELNADHAYGNTITYETLGFSEYYNQILSPFTEFMDEHTLEPNEISPVLIFNGPTSVVTSVSSSAPTKIDSEYKAAVDYYYREGKVQAGGRGYLGFKSLTTIDQQTGVKTETTYRQDWPFSGTPVKTVTQSPGGNLLKQSSSIHAIHGVNLTEGDEGADISDLRSAFRQGGSVALGPIQLFNQFSEDKNYDLPTLNGDGSETAGELISRITTSNRKDEFGNALNVTVSHFDAESIDPEATTVTISEFGEDNWSRRMGRLSKTLVTSTRKNKPSKTRETIFEYVGIGEQNTCSLEALYFGMLCKETIAPNESDKKVETEHFYDEFGNQTHTVSTSVDGVRVSDYVEYDSLGRYPYRSYSVFSEEASTFGSTPSSDYNTVAEGLGNIQLVQQVISRDKHGTALETHTFVGANNIVVNKAWTTPFGAPYFIASSDGSYKQTLSSLTDLDNCPSEAVYTTWEYSAGGSQSRTCFDILGRKVRSATLGFDGASWSAVDTEYDGLNRVKRVSEPYYLGGTSYWTDFEYDLLDRVVLTTLPIFETDENGVESDVRATAQVVYAGLDKTLTNPKGQQKIETQNVLGELVQVVTTEGATTFEYDAYGNMELMTGPDQKTTTIEFDSLGRKTSMDDPSKGVWRYKYNAFGDLVCQQDAKLQIIENVYDFAGRIVERRDRRSGGSCENPTGDIIGHSFWHFDTAAYGLGNVDWEEDAVSGFSQHNTYDSFGRPSMVTTEFPGYDGATSTHFEKMTYDHHGRAYQTFDSARNSASFEHNGVQKAYNAAGYLESLSNTKNSANDEVYYSIEEMDARGNVTKANYNSSAILLDNGFNPRSGLLEVAKATVGMYQIQNMDLRWDHVGNVAYRHERGTGSGTTSKDLKESFGYDEVNRLTNYGVSVGGSATDSVAMTYFANGNVKTKSDVGSSDYTYDPVQPHAVKTAGGVTYSYDANGNMVSDTSGRTLEYSVFDKVEKITVEGKHITEFDYSTSRGRFKRVDTPLVGEAGQTTTLYVGGVEKVYHPDNTVEWRRNIGGVALVTHRFDATWQETEKATRYLLKDHLGSTNLIISSAGAVEQEMAFDPWGKRRVTTDWSEMEQANLESIFALSAMPITTRGFTDHEMLDESGIIHMNGRIYDARIGRFLQADPFIQEPTAPGNLNRYSYVMNNPVNAADPTGYFFLEIFALAYIGSKNEALGQVIGLAGAVAAGMYCFPYGGAAASAGCAAAFSGVYTAMLASRNGYSDIDAFGMGAQAGATSAVTSGMFLAIGGAFGGSPVSEGGSFWGLKTSGGFWHITAHATAGGVLSKMQGGEFKHGFISAGVTKGVMSHVGFDYYNRDNWAIAGRTAFAALVGGTVSELTGGKFKNGAMTAALAHLFNAEGQGAVEAARKERFSFEVNNKGKAFPEKMKERFLTVAETIEGDIAWGSDETVKVFYNPKFKPLVSNNAHAIAYRSSSGDIQIVLGKMSSGSGLFRSIVAEEIYHAADYSRGLLHSGMSQSTAWQGEVRAISYVLQNRSSIGFGSYRAGQLQSNLSNYQTCLGGGSTSICN